MLEEHKLRNQMLKSLVLNVPTSVDSFSTSPTISKVFSFPLGIKVSSTTLIKSIFNLIFFLSIMMTVTCFLLLSFYLPIQAKNYKLYSTAKIITGKKFSLLVNLQEASSYTKLFSASELLSFVDPEEVIHVNNNNSRYTQIKKTLKIKYPSIQFAGF